MLIQSIIPIGAEENFTGLIDLSSMQALIYDEKDETGMTFETTEIPSEYEDQAQKYRESLIEALADFDDELADKYLEGEELSADDIRSAIRKATISRFLCGPTRQCFQE